MSCGQHGHCGHRPDCDDILCPGRPPHNDSSPHTETITATVVWLAVTLWAIAMASLYFWRY